MITSQEINKLAGLLEGEGYFGFHRTSHTPVIKLKMSDRDIVEWASRLLGGKITFDRREKAHYKDQYTVQVWGHKAAGWMMTLYALMGARRKEKIRNVLSQWRAVARTQKGVGFGKAKAA